MPPPPTRPPTHHPKPPHLNPPPPSRPPPPLWGPSAHFYWGGFASKSEETSPPWSRVGFQPYLPLEGFCVPLERSVGHDGALPVAYVAMLCWVLWLGVGEVFGLRLADVSLPLWLQFLNSKTWDEGWQSRPVTPWADRFWEALLQWGEARGLCADGRHSPGGSAGLEQKFLEVLAPTPWRRCQWHAL